MSNNSLTIDEWAELPEEERKKCSIGNQQMYFLLKNFTEYKNPLEAIDVVKNMIKNELDFVGLTERYQDSMQLLSYELNINLNQYRVVFNYNNYNKKINENTRDILTKLNLFDMIIYKYAKELFEKRFNEMINDLGRDLNDDEIFSPDKNKTTLCGCCENYICKKIIFY